MAKNIVLFEKDYYFAGILNVIAIALVAIGVFYAITETYLLSIAIGLLLSSILFLLLNKRWFKKLIIQNEGIIIEIPLNLIGKKRINLNYQDKIIREVIYYDYMYRTPSHCKIVSGEGIFRFDCSHQEAEKIFGLLKTKGISVSYYNKKEVGYR